MSLSKALFIFWLIPLSVLAFNGPLDPFNTLFSERGSVHLSDLHKESLLQNSDDRIVGGTYPFKCNPSIIAEDSCSGGKMIWKDSSGAFMIIQPIWSLQYELRNAKNGISTDYGLTEGGEGVQVFRNSPGLRLWANKDFAYLWMEARIYGENQSHFIGSPDGQYIESQEAGDNSSFSYLSYARFMGGVNFTTSIGELGISRNSLHWGPSYFFPLIVGKFTPPINHIYYQIQLGNFAVTSFYGSADIGSQGRFTASKFDKTLIGHRYQYDFKYLSIALNELLVLFDTSEPLAFVPAFPLFMYKGQTREPDNNGNISLDITGKIKTVRLYGEFLIDDISEPSQLFNGYWKNRWAYTFGAHYAVDRNVWSAGTILEFSRVEPWVYTHYVANTAQASHFDFPLGNPLGPNSFGLSHLVYFKTVDWSAELEQGWSWKGTDSGSRITDIHQNEETDKKAFLKNKEPMSYFVKPTLRVHQEYWAIEASTRIKWQKLESQLPEASLILWFYY